MVLVQGALCQWSVLSQGVYVESPALEGSTLPSLEPLAPRVLFVPPLFCDLSPDPHVTIPRKRGPVVAEAIAPRYVLP